MRFRSTFLKVLLGLFLAALFMVMALFFIMHVGFSKQNSVETVRTSQKNVNCIPFEYTSTGHIKISVGFAKGTSHDFLFDTGASSFMFEDFAQTVDKEFDWIMPSIDANFIPSVVKTYKLDKLNFGGFILFKNASFKKDKQFTNHCDSDVKGIIGVNIMKDLKWRINFSSKEIEIADDINKFSIKNPVDTIRTIQNPNSHHLKVMFSSPSDPSGINKPLLVDTGYNGYLTITKKHTSHFKDSVIFKGATSKGLYSEEPNESIYFTREFSIGGKEFEAIQINAANRSINALGLNFFKQFNSVVLDWDNNLLLLEYKTSNPVFFKRSFGVSFRFEDKRCYLNAAIKTKTKDLTPYLDQQIVTINGTKIINNSQLCELDLSKAEILELEFITAENGIKKVIVKKEPFFVL